MEELSEWLDGVEASSQTDSVESLSSEECRQLADELVVHGLLCDAARRERMHDETRLQGVLAAVDHSESPVASKSRTRSRLAVVSGLAAMAACVLIALAVMRPTTATAAVALERIIESVSQAIDRAYRINVLEEYSERRRPQNLPEERWQTESKEELDGAMLYVGGPHRYVFVRQLKDGRTRVSGCNGIESWAFREDGPVHISHDLARFRGGLPGQQQSIGFTDIRAQLASLREGYEIELHQGEGSEFDRLIAERKSRDVRGPKHVEIEFDSTSGTIYHMLLDGLPRGGGGPKSVSLELVSRTDLGTKFFSHEAHHNTGRQVKVEP
jgi:hypothetical protein